VSVHKVGYFVIERYFVLNPQTLQYAAIIPRLLTVSAVSLIYIHLVCILRENGVLRFVQTLCIIPRVCA